jgi:carbon-monoxide dehydrogenase iron sulfur subunit
MKIKVEKIKCSGCHLCEMVCSLSHLGIINTGKSAIRIRKDDLNTSLSVPVLCHQCKEMKCLNGEDVMEGLEKKKFIWHRIRAERCPFDAIHVFGKEAYHCDLCGGIPQCVKVCTPKAIWLSNTKRGK